MAQAVERRSSRYLLLGLVLVHLALISRQVDARGGTSFLSRAVYTLTLPIERAVSAVVRGVKGVWFGYVDLRRARSENDGLRKQVATLEGDLAGAREDGQEAARLRELVGIRKVLPVRTAVARIIARDALPWFQVVMIDKGRGDGVALNAAVISSSGVVGRVIELAERAAKVQVLLDPNTNVGVASERSRVTGVVAGQMGTSPGSALDERSDLDRALDVASRGDLLMKYVSAVSDIAVGDSVVTSGFDQVYPRGLLVGRVSYVGPSTGLFKEVRVTPSTRFDSLEEVMILDTPQPLPTDFTSVKKQQR